MIGRHLARIFWLGFIVILLTSAAVSAQETLPPYHWATRYVEYFKVRGYFPDLSLSERPFSRQQIAGHLLGIKWKAVRQNPGENKMLRVLFREFSAEIRQLGDSADGGWRQLIENAMDYLRLTFAAESINPQLKIGAFGEVGGFSMREADQSDATIDLHSQAAFFWKNYLTLYNNFRVFNNPQPGYIGKEYGGLYAYNEQAYMIVNTAWMQAKFGRDFFQIGPGRSGQLLISDNSRTFDMYHVSLGSGMLKYTFWGIQLDSRTVNDTTSRFAGEEANRYLNGHRLALQLHRRYHIGVSEVVLYGGAGRVWNFGFMNPINFYYLQNLNLVNFTQRGNLAYNIDWDIYPADNLEIYGEFLLDDFQVDNELPADLEPNEFGLMLGVNWTAPAGLSGGMLNLEYTQVRNRTYNVRGNDWEKFLHRNQVIGYYLGNNFERYSSGFSYWVRPDLNIGISAMLVRQGEGSVQGEFNEDFLDATVEAGYSESFPFGVVERQLQWGIAGFYKPHENLHISGELFLDDFGNYRHVSNATLSELTARINLWLQWDRIFAASR